jgi:hypothetical protein
MAGAATPAVKPDEKIAAPEARASISSEIGGVRAESHITKSPKMTWPNWLPSLANKSSHVKRSKKEKLGLLLAPAG